MLSYIYGAQLLVLCVSRDAWRDAEMRDQGRSVRFWKCTHTQTREVCENFLQTFSKGHFNKWKNAKYKVKLQHYKCLLSENLPISQVRTCVFAKRTPRLWYFVCFCTLLFSRKISHFSLCCHTISLRYLLKWAVENLVIFTTWEAFPSHFLHRGTVV